VRFSSAALLYLVALANCGLAQVTYRTFVGPAQPRLLVTVVDENGVAIPSARVSLQASPTTKPLLRETNFAGHCQFDNPASGSQLRVEKPGFYASSFVMPVIPPGQSISVDMTLLHTREVREVVNVVESPPAIDPAQTSSQEQLTGVDIVNIPYPVTRDYRNVLNFIPSVVQDVNGQPHVAGAETYQTLTLLDGFNITQPANGQLLMRVSTDALRSVNVETSRYSAEYGKGSGGVLDLNTGIGDDHFRFASTDFIPSLQDKKGIGIDKLNPRVTFSGPIKKGRLWFFEGIDGEYDNIIIPELPPGSDHDIFWRVGNIAKLQANLTPRNILTTDFNYNLSHDQHSGISRFNPPQATPVIDAPVHQASMKDQHYFSGGELLETGIGFNQYDLDQTPRGLEPYFVSPETTGGNYYFKAQTQADRWQALGNLYLAPWQWRGRHEVRVGIDLDRLRYGANFLRQPISFLREGQTLPPDGNCLSVTPSPCSRYSTFPGEPNLVKHNVELSGYAQDRWFITNRFLIETGLRYDWDQIVRHSLFSPRVATTYVLDNAGNTKISAGVGVFYDATPLFLIVRPRAGQRVDFFFDANGNLFQGPVTMTFNANPSKLQAPRFINWSLGLERKLPAQIYLKAEFIQKRGVHDFAYNTAGSVPPISADGNFLLQNTRQDHYDSFQVNIRRSFLKGHLLMASYTHSKSNSNQVLDFNVDNPIFNAQLPGPYPWDTPNRVLSWGLLPLLKGFDLGYSTEVRSGFPFSVVNDQQQLVEAPDSRRFPHYFALNLHLEKRFGLFGFNWAIRGGFDNITDHKNPGVVNNDINSPEFLTFGGFARRAFTGRIRFLGKK
jgi:hypothetical protein